MTRLMLLAGVMLAGALCGCSESQPMADRDAAPDVPAAGVPLTLAQDRAGRVSDLRYELHVTIPDAVATPVRGTVTLRFQLSDASRALALDFAGPAASIRDVRAQGTAVSPAVRDEHVVFPASALRRGANELTLSFDSSDLALNRNPEFMYTLFVPARARLAFPCFDQPNLKARYQLTLDAPAGWETIANGAEQKRTTEGSSIRRTFAETRPIPTYLFAFAAGRFSVETAERGGRQLRMLHRETDAQKVARNRDTIFDLHAAALAWLEEYTAIPYPFEKFDFLLVPSFQFGGMEHPGSVFYNAASLFLDPSATQNQQLGRASLIAHETAHMWFGDLVTMAWFDDVWMKEVFANFMAAKIVNPSFPKINHELRFLYAHYPAAYDVDRTEGTNAIRQRLDNLNEAGSLYGAIIYQKAPIVMRQLEMIVTPDGLRDGLREYLGAHAYANATWPDLIEVLDRRTPEDLAAWSRAWVEQAGRPTITSEVRLQNGTLLMTFKQADPEHEGNLSWTQRLNVVVDVDERLRTDALNIAARGREYSASINHVSGKPRYVLPTGGGIGYGDFVLDPDSRGYLTTRLHEIRDPLTRGAALVTLWEEMLDARVPPEVMFTLLQHSLPRETDELNIARMLTCTQRLFWKFLSADQRTAHAAPLEAMLRRGLDAAPTQSLKSAWFSALREVALTPPTLAWLERVWDRKATSPRSDLRGTRRHQPGARPRGARGAVMGAHPRGSAGAHPESGSPGAVRLRAAGAVSRRRRPRHVLREPARRAQPRTRVMGAAGPRLPASSAARRGRGEAHSGQPRSAARDSAHRRHLLPEALDGRDAQRTSVRERRVEGECVSEAGIEGLSRAPAAHRPLVGGRPVPRERRPGSGTVGC